MCRFYTVAFPCGHTSVSLDPCAHHGKRQIDAQGEEFSCKEFNKFIQDHEHLCRACFCAALPESLDEPAGQATVVVESATPLFSPPPSPPLPPSREMEIISRNDAYLRRRANGGHRVPTTTMLFDSPSAAEIHHQICVNEEFLARRYERKCERTFLEQENSEHQLHVLSTQAHKVAEEMLMRSILAIQKWPLSPLSDCSLYDDDPGPARKSASTQTDEPEDDPKLASALDPNWDPFAPLTPDNPIRNISTQTTLGLESGTKTPDPVISISSDSFSATIEDPHRRNALELVKEASRKLQRLLDLEDDGDDTIAHAGRSGQPSTQGREAVWELDEFAPATGEELIVWQHDELDQRPHGRFNAKWAMGLEPDTEPDPKSPLFDVKLTENPPTGTSKDTISAKAIRDIFGPFRDPKATVKPGQKVSVYTLEGSELLSEMKYYLGLRQDTSMKDVYAFVISRVDLMTLIHDRQGLMTPRFFTEDRHKPDFNKAVNTLWFHNTHPENLWLQEAFLDLWIILDWTPPSNALTPAEGPPPRPGRPDKSSQLLSTAAQKQWGKWIEEKTKGSNKFANQGRCSNLQIIQHEFENELDLATRGLPGVAQGDSSSFDGVQEDLERLVYPAAACHLTGNRDRHRFRVYNTSPRYCPPQMPSRLSQPEPAVPLVDLQTISETQQQSDSEDNSDIVEDPVTTELPFRLIPAAKGPRVFRLKRHDTPEGERMLSLIRSLLCIPTNRPASEVSLFLARNPDLLAAISDRAVPLPAWHTRPRTRRERLWRHAFKEQPRGMLRTVASLKWSGIERQYREAIQELDWFHIDSELNSEVSPTTDELPDADFVAEIADIADEEFVTDVENRPVLSGAVTLQFTLNSTKAPSPLRQTLSLTDLISVPLEKDAQEISEPKTKYEDQQEQIFDLYQDSGAKIPPQPDLRPHAEEGLPKNLSGDTPGGWI